MSEIQSAGAGYESAAQPSAQQAQAILPERRQLFDPRRKSPLLAAVLSVAPGLGNVYIGYYVRGFTIASTFGLIILMAAMTREPVAPIFGMAAFFVWMFNIIDAGRMAALYNHAMTGRGAVELPEDFKLPKMGGSIVGGAILLLFGAIAMSNTVFGISLDWIETWWPVFPIALGAYLLFRGVQDYQKQQGNRTAASPLLEESD